ncbi:MAG: DNA alkylation repair protein [Planctomycetota bacterium]|jgi:3-methyladenine DNA glycosylase AlkD
MNLKQVMQQLEKSGTDTYRKIWPRHGIQPPLFGVKYADLYKLQKKIGCDHELAQGLWRTGNHDARILATLIVDTEALTSKELDSWIGAAGNHVLNDAVSGVAAKSPLAQKKADAWRKVKGEWKSAAGWNLVGYLAAPGAAATDAWLKGRLSEIAKGIHKAPNRTRHSMNNALISIGGYRPALRADALAIAKKIGKVDVDHGETSCKTPDAGPYIRKMAKRHTAKKKTAKRKTRARSKA